MRSSVRCAGCGASPVRGEPPFRCPNAGKDGGDHVMAPRLELSGLGWPDAEEGNPFIRYRQLLHSYHLAREAGMSDAEFVALVERLDGAVAEVDGKGFTATRTAPSRGLAERLGFGRGKVWVKDETVNVSGSHKARHLMGLLLFLEVAEREGLMRGRPELAIASCGNAALAAAVVARAGGRALRVLVPSWADPWVLERLRSLGAVLETCPRPEGVPGDPTYLRLQEAVRQGALPFTCQGPDNGMTIEGGQTLGFEVASELRASASSLDRVFIQVGGGALASACVQAFREAVSLGAMRSLPRIHAVQTAGGHPLERAYVRLAQRILRGLGKPPSLAGTALGAQHILEAGAGAREESLRHAASRRAELMWAWEEEPKSIARGILDDETYDWLEVVKGMLESGGFPVLVSEERLEEANAIGRESTGIDADHTGTAGLAGLIELERQGAVGGEESALVLFTGARRPSLPGGHRPPPG